MADAFEVFPRGSRLDAALLTALQESKEATMLGACDPAGRCPVLFADLNRDGSEEAVFFAGHAVLAASRRADGWKILEYRPHRAAAGPQGDISTISQALEQGRYRVVDLPWQAIEINGEYYVVTDP